MWCFAARGKEEDDDAGISGTIATTATTPFPLAARDTTANTDTNERVLFFFFFFFFDDDDDSDDAEFVSFRHLPKDEIANILRPNWTVRADEIDLKD
jgi:hypothetical protein